MFASQRKSLVAGLVAGVAYGVVTYLAFSAENALPTATFLFLVPAIMGGLSMLFSDEDQAKNYLKFLVVPWITVLTFLAVLVAFFKEGALCFVILGLPLFGGALVGSFIVWLVKALRIRSAKKKLAAGAALMLLPFVLAPVELQHLSTETVSVPSNIVVEAPAEQVFSRLAAVDTITDAEYRPGLFQRLGVPRPIRATVDVAGPGGHRTGEFTENLKFNELITTFDPPRKMTFSIAVDPRQLREGSAERHAFESGYFRFVDASYELEPISDKRTRLVLSSRYVVKSGANFYGKPWAHAVVSDFQERVLGVLKHRLEAGDELAVVPR